MSNFFKHIYGHCEEPAVSGRATKQSQGFEIASLRPSDFVRNDDY